MMIVLHRSARASLLLVLLIFSAQAIAEEIEKPREFYKSDFVKRSVDVSQVRASFSGKAHAKMKAKEKKDELDNQSSKPEAAPVKEDGKPASFLRLHEMSVSADGDGIPIRSIGAVLNATEEKHFLESLNELIMVSAEYDLHVSEVHSVGLVGESGKETMKLLAHSPQLFSLVALEGRMIPTAQVPDFYKVKSSPAWLVTTEKGTIVLEGLPALRKVVNRKGELVLTGAAAQFGIEKKLVPKGM